MPAVPAFAVRVGGMSITWEWSVRSFYFYQTERGTVRVELNCETPAHTLRKVYYEFRLKVCFLSKEINFFFITPGLYRMLQQSYDDKYYRQYILKRNKFYKCLVFVDVSLTFVFCLYNIFWYEVCVKSFKCTLCFHWT